MYIAHVYRWTSKQQSAECPEVICLKSVLDVRNEGNQEAGKYGTTQTRTKMVKTEDRIILLLKIQCLRPCLLFSY